MRLMVPTALIMVVIKNFTEFGSVNRYRHFVRTCYIILQGRSEVQGYAVGQLVEAMRYKSEGRGFDSRWCHWNFSLT